MKSVYLNSKKDFVIFFIKLIFIINYKELDLVTKNWVNKRYTYLIDFNEQETFKKMYHGFRMGWLKLC